VSYYYDRKEDGATFWKATLSMPWSYGMQGGKWGVVIGQNWVKLPSIQELRKDRMTYSTDMGPLLAMKAKVLDALTGLEWMRPSSGKIQFSDADKAALATLLLRSI
jgi:hypothetical protein